VGVVFLKVDASSHLNFEVVLGSSNIQAGHSEKVLKTKDERDT
jgi:hypothetical protein